MAPVKHSRIAFAYEGGGGILQSLCKRFGLLSGRIMNPLSIESFLYTTALFNDAVVRLRFHHSLDVREVSRVIYAKESPDNR